MSATDEWKAVLSGERKLTEDPLTWANVQDSGARTEFPTGSVRDIRNGKGRYDLIPPRGLRRLAVHFENGAKKYGDRNWEKGQNLHCFLDSAIRHLYAYLEGKRDEDHLAAAAWNAVCAIHTEEMIAEGLLPEELDDLRDCQDDHSRYQALADGGFLIRPFVCPKCQKII